MRSFYVVAALAIGLSAPSLALAQGVGQACHVRSICGGVSPGGGRVVACLAHHRAELPVACKVALADRMLNRSSRRGGGRMAMGARMGQGGMGPGAGGYEPQGGPGGGYPPAYGQGAGPGRGPADMDPDGY